MQNPANLIWVTALVVISAWTYMTPNAHPDYNSDQVYQMQTAAQAQ